MAALVRKRRRTLGSYKGNWFVSDCKNIRGREGERERGGGGRQRKRGRGRECGRWCQSNRRPGSPHQPNPLSPECVYVDTLLFNTELKNQPGAPPPPAPPPPALSVCMTLLSSVPALPFAAAAAASCSCV